MPACGIDTSVFVRLLTGLPEAEHEMTIRRLTAIRSSQPEPITASNIVIAEAYAVLQHHFGQSKAEARAAISSILTSGLVEPTGGDEVLTALAATKEPGLTDRLIALDYATQRTEVLTLDRKMSALPGCRRL